jgi:outer membrane receptor protein involved in Fe transport
VGLRARPDLQTDPAILSIQSIRPLRRDRRIGAKETLMSRTYLAGASAMAIAALLNLQPAHAQTTGSSAQSADQKDTVLDAVTVSAGRGAQLKALDVSTTTIDRAQVELAPETTLDQIVNKIPGIFTSQQPASQIHPTGQAFSIRGFGTTTNVNTLVMVDGAPMNDPYFRTVDWGQLPKASIERIEVIRGGGASSLWGNMAMGGIVNVVSQTPGPGSNLVDVSYGSFNTYAGDVALGFAPTDYLKLGATYDITKTDGYNQTPAQYRNPYMVPTGSQNQNISVSAILTPTAGSTFYLKFLDHRIHEHGLIWDLTSNEWDTDRVNFGGSVRLSGMTSLNFAGWYGWNKMATTNASTTPSFSIFAPTVGVPYVSQTEAVTYDSYGAAAFINSEWGAIKDIKAGVDFRVISAKDPLNLFSATTQTGTIVARASHAFEGLFAQGTLRPESIPVEITLGLREDFWQTSDGSINGVYKGAAFANTLGNHSYAHFDPRLGIKYHLTDAVAFRAAVYEDFAAPGMNQMYRSFISGANFTTSNPTLNAQTNLGEEAGVDVTRGGLSLTVTGFYNNLSNFIDYATVQSGCASANNYCGTGIATIAGGSLRQYVNAGNAVFSGVEVLGGWKVSDAFAVNASFTQTDAHLTSSRRQTPSSGVIPDPVGMQIGQVPPWMVTAGASWSPIDRLTLSLQVKSFPAYWNNTSHTQRNDAATIADISVAYRVYKTLEVFGVAQNVGSATYYDQGLAYTTTNGSTLSGSTIPALGMPLNLTIGLRASF